MRYSFYVYVSGAGSDKVQHEVDALSDGAAEKLNTRLRYMESLAANEWEPRFVKKLRGVKHDIYEIRFKDRNVEHRPLGCFYPAEGGFTLLIMTTKTSAGRTKWKPSEADDTASRRSKELQERKSDAHPLKLFGETFSEIG